VYMDLKYAVSDGMCAALQPVSSELFTSICRRFFDEFFVTIELLLLSMLFGFFLAVAVTLARLSGLRALALPANAFAYTFRGTPLHVQLWIVYFGIGSLNEEGLGPFLWPIIREPWTVGLIVLVLNTSAYASEILRGGLVNVPHGQMEAALTVGMSWLQAMRRIMLPQALRIAWPAYGNEIVLLMKGSALVSTITVMDLMGQTRTVFARSFNLEVYLYSALLYLLLAGALTLVLSGIERTCRTEMGRSAG
jgi:His/Glu/Gln/Arg/opine family amino acid ABC transporter permease subunit